MLGIIGGMSWESTATYYAEINRRYNRARGGHHSAPVILWSVDFAPIEAMQRAGDWSAAAGELAAAARALETAGATTLLLATNTMHLVFAELAAATTVPWVHIADATADALVAAGRRRVGLLGTRFTMEQAFYRERVCARAEAAGASLEIIAPAPDDRTYVDGIIFGDLVHGRVPAEARVGAAAVVERLVAAGCDSVILGCTELGMLRLDEASDGVSPATVPLFDTTAIHVEAAVGALLG